ncbi:MAG: GDSL-type esterase/lipase family protein [Flavobacteriia bacterium]|jgi:lysophospholipase L1-like esterase
MRCLLLICSIPLFVLGQTPLLCTNDSLSKVEQEIARTYPFIEVQCNQFQFFGNESPNWMLLNRELSQMIESGKGKLNFYHIGGSHLQADIYSHDFRTFLQSNWPGLSGERGLVFPYNLAHTNNPSNYDFSSPNTWRGYRSVTQRSEDFDYGLSGAAITCSDSLVVINFKHLRTLVKPPFDRLRIYHNTGEFPYELNFGDQELLVTDVAHYPEMGYTEVRFSDHLDSLDLLFVKKINTPFALELFGFEFLNDLPGITYTAIGINGASLPTYLANTNFSRDLQLRPPDLFILSVGTNDAHCSYDAFDPLVYKANLEKLILQILESNPNCAILLTVPNDDYYMRKYPNRNTARQREVIFQLAAQYQMAVWDFYGIMGELGSSKTWKTAGLMQADYVHFTGTGYHLKGTLLIEAFKKNLSSLHNLRN